VVLRSDYKTTRLQDERYPLTPLSANPGNRVPGGCSLPRLFASSSKGGALWVDVFRISTFTITTDRRDLARKGRLCCACANFPRLCRRMRSLSNHRPWAHHLCAQGRLGDIIQLEQDVVVRHGNTGGGCRSRYRFPFGPPLSRAGLRRRAV
jgi:hypothetical protein